jgi:hypothetical protein
MKLTPTELSKEPLKVAVSTDNYDFSTQKRANFNPALGNSTQTFSTTGKPMDSDR